MKIQKEESLNLPPFHFRPPFRPPPCINNRNQLIVKVLEQNDVPGAGIEPARDCSHWFLRPTRLPIPPSGRGDRGKGIKSFVIPNNSSAGNNINPDGGLQPR